MKVKSKKRRWLWVISLVLVPAMLLVGCWTIDAPAAQVPELRSFALQNGISLRAWPEELVRLYRDNPEAAEFALQYPLKKGKTVQPDMMQYLDTGAVPLLLQWDEHWGYAPYGSSVVGITGCGPTCLSMVCLYLLQDGKYDPAYVAEFSEKQGYYAPGYGSSWTLISEGGKKLGLQIQELPLDENLILRSLREGSPVICAMGPGDFTASGHFIVIVGEERGCFRIHDPNSRVRSAQLWEYQQISSQIRNLWSCSLPE